MTEQARLTDEEIDQHTHWMLAYCADPGRASVVIAICSQAKLANRPAEQGEGTQGALEALNRLMGRVPTLWGDHVYDGLVTVQLHEDDIHFAESILASQPQAAQVEGEVTLMSMQAGIMRQVTKERNDAHARIKELEEQLKQCKAVDRLVDFLATPEAEMLAQDGPQSQPEQGHAKLREAVSGFVDACNKTKAQAEGGKLTGWSPVMAYRYGEMKAALASPVEPQAPAPKER